MSDIKGIYSNSLTALTLPSEAQVRINQQRALFVRLTDDTGAYVAPGGGTTDEAAWTAGSSSFNPTGGAFNDSAQALTSGQQGTARATANRALHVNVRDHLGNEATLTGNSLNVNVTNGAAGGTSLADKAAFTVGTTNGTPAFGLVRTDVPDLVADATAASLASTLRRGLHVNLRTQTGTELLGQQLMAASIPVTLASNQSALSVTATNLFALDSTVAKDASVTGLQVAQGSTTSGQKGGLCLGAVTTSAPAYTTAQSSPLSLTTAGLLRVDGSGVTQPVSGTVTANAGTNLNTSLLALDTSVNGILVAQGSTTSGQKGPLLQAAVLTAQPTYTTAQTSPLVMTTNGALRVSVDQIGAANVSLGSKTSANSFPVVIASDQGNVPVSQATASSLNAQVVGNVADAASDSGNPVKIGAVVYTTSRTNLTTLQRANLNCDHQGTLVTYPIKPREFLRTQQTTITASTAETTIITAGGAGVFNDITSLTITNSSATATLVTLKDATAGTTRAIYSIAANGGLTINFTTPLAQQAAANNNWTLTCGTSVSSIYVSAAYVIAL